MSSVTSFYRAFNGCENFASDVSAWQVGSVESFNHAFRGTQVNSDFSNWDISSVVSMSRMFYGTPVFEGIGLENWDVSNVIDFSYMFDGAVTFTGESIVNWNVSGVQASGGESCYEGRCGLYEMFDGATNFNQNLCHWLDLIEYDEDTNPVPVDGMFFIFD